MDAEYIEVWKVLDFIGFDNYAISNWGRCKSLNFNHTGNERLLKPGKTKNGYSKVKLFKDGKHKWFSVHRLVAMAFLPNPDNLPQVNHKNEDKTDNRLFNLEWCTVSYNNNYLNGQKRRAEKISKSVNQYTKDGLLIASYPSVDRQRRYCKDKGKSWVIKKADIFQSAFKKTIIIN